MRIRAVTFDVYSALFDTVRGLEAALEPLFRARGSADAAAAAQRWRQYHVEYLLVANSLDREPARNRTALTASAQRTLRGLTPPPTADEITGLISTWEMLPPWQDAVPVLTQIRRRSVLLGTLSNGDMDMQRALLARLPVTFDQIISTEGGKFKPHPSVYAQALERLGLDAHELLHVAGSGTDAAGATAVGIRTVWVNRAGDAVADPRFAPADDVRTLQEALAVIEKLI